MQNKVFQKIARERKAQDAKWGEQNHHDGYWSLILSEEVGELAKAILQDDGTNLDEELTQVAAVAVAWMECRSRNVATPEESPQ